MRYARKPLTAPPGGKIRSYHSYLKNGTKYGEKVNYKVVQHHRFITKKHLAHKNDTNEKHKTNIRSIALNKTALAGSSICHAQNGILQQQYTSGHGTALPAAHCTTWQVTRWHKHQ
ncbi:hypothetical protein AVEN_208626-1 [Araneus ventricosus]|uniref:Uncharacterized protein n=1 Tax=Araneus ventricosus TaxID=182803 RepID=A0A4Y2GNI5_ARAVE|nr:hypothetical protein AVEN_208626-1 [Araneus ventricosus]